MAACAANCSEDFLLDDEFDAVLAILDAYILENNDDFLEQTETSLQKVTAAETSTFSGKFYDKVCLSENGMTRHLNEKHPKANIEKTVYSNDIRETEILVPVFLKSLVENSAVKLSNDECYPVTVCSAFKDYQIQDICKMYNLTEPLLVSFNGGSKIFYPKFYKLFIYKFTGNGNCKN